MTFEQVFILVFLLIYGSMFYTLGRQHSVQMIDKLLEEKIKELTGGNSDEGTTD